MIKSAEGLLHVSALAEQTMITLFTIAKDSATNKAELVHFVIRMLKLIYEKLPKDIVSKLRELDRRLTGKSFWDRFTRHILLTNWDEQNIVKGGIVSEDNTPNKRVLKLVQEIIKQPKLLKKLLPRFVVSNGYLLYQFGQELALAVNDRSYDSLVVAAHKACLPTVMTQFCGGYFAGVRQLDRDASFETSGAIFCNLEKYAQDRWFASDESSQPYC